MIDTIEHGIKNGTVGQCVAHDVFYNIAAGCPMCAGIPKKEKLAPEPRGRNNRNIKSVCQYCGAGTIYSNRVCSIVACLKKAGLNFMREPLMTAFICKMCGSKTKNADRICTKYDCMRRAGKVRQYYAQHS